MVIEAPLPRPGARHALTLALIVALPAAARPASALDEQGSAHGGDVGGQGDDGLHVAGSLIFGSALYNPTYAARPDNTGKALLRYALHAEVSAFHDLVSVGLDGTLFNDRTKNALRPSELDLTPEIIVRSAPFELHLAYERDMPLGRGGLVQSFVYALGVWGFDLKGAPTRPLEEKTQIVSP